MRALTLLALVLAAGCAWTSTAVAELEDVRGDGERRQAVSRMARWLQDPGLDPALRLTSARTLGRLRLPQPDAVSALRVVLLTVGEEAALRATAAWALGQMRSEPSLDALIAALRVPMEGLIGDYVLQALARHIALIEREAERSQQVVEGLVFFAGNQREPPPPVYQYLNARLRTPEVNRRVLESILASPRGTSEQRLAIIQAVHELFRSLEMARDAIRGRPEAWRATLEAAVKLAGRAFATGDRATRAMLLHRLGRLSDLPEVAQPAGRLLAGEEALAGLRPLASAEPRLRLLSLWALYRMLPHVLGPRACLQRELLVQETDPGVLELLRALSPAGADALQKILGQEGGASP
ncbi:MAG: hypothetical protein GYA21_18685 [Myxococcales bacterium]|nr:hypothetical protein [Myxococcales bacterium]